MDTTPSHIRVAQKLDDAHGDAWRVNNSWDGNLDDRVQHMAQTLSDSQWIALPAGKTASDYALLPFKLASKPVEMVFKMVKGGVDDGASTPGEWGGSAARTLITEFLGGKIGKAVGRRVAKYFVKNGADVAAEPLGNGAGKGAKSLFNAGRKVKGDGSSSPAPAVKPGAAPLYQGTHLTPRGSAVHQ